MRGTRVIKFIAFLTVVFILTSFLAKVKRNELNLVEQDLVPTSDEEVDLISLWGHIKTVQTPSTQPVRNEMGFMRGYWARESDMIRIYFSSHAFYKPVDFVCAVSVAGDKYLLSTNDNSSYAERTAEYYDNGHVNTILPSCDYHVGKFLFKKRESYVLLLDRNNLNILGNISLFWETDHKQKYQVSIVTMVRNFDRYLKEWVVYHKMIGIDHIFIYDDGSTDNSLEVIKPFVDEGFVTWTDFKFAHDNACRKVLGDQRDFYYRYRKLTKYAIHMDADCFLIPYMKGQPSFNLKAKIKELESRPIFKDAKQFLVFWKTFGHSGLTNASPLVTQGYFWRSDQIVREFLVKGGDKVLAMNSIVRTDHIDRKLQYTNVHLWLPHAYNKDTFFLDVGDIVIHHYKTKSLEEFTDGVKKGIFFTIENSSTDEWNKKGGFWDVYDDAMKAYDKPLQKALRRY